MLYSRWIRTSEVLSDSSASVVNTTNKRSTFYQNWQTSRNRRQSFLPIV